MKRPPRGARRLLAGVTPTDWHTRWSAKRRPVGRVRPGETIDLVIPEASGGQLTPRSTRRALGRLDLDRADPAVGPFAVEGARPGDALRVRLERIQVGEWGWSAVFWEFGLLRHRCRDDLVSWRIADGTAVPHHGFLGPVRVPVRPMLGWIGTSPARGDHPMIAPRRTGGNMDSRLHAPGTTVILPVEVPEALVSFGDPHASMGDGEVSGTGIEVPARVRVRVDLVRGDAPRFPRAEVPRLTPESGPQWVTTGIGPDLLQAARAAVNGMIEWIERKGRTAEEAYLLVSIAGHLRLSEVVDRPNHVVSLTFPCRLLDSRPVGQP